MRLSLIVALSSAFFRSYFRSSGRNASFSFFSKPKVMLALDIALFAAPAIVLQYILVTMPVDVKVALAPMVVQAMISLPLLLTSAVIVSGLIFETGPRFCHLVERGCELVASFTEGICGCICSINILTLLCLF